MMPFFSPPPLRTTAIWARLPDAFRKPHSNEWTRYNARGKALHSLLEGPALDAQGRLYVCDVPFGRIFRIDPDSREWTLVVQYDGWPNGLKVAADGTLYVADYKRGLLSIDPSTGRVTTLAARYLSEGLKGINDLCLTPSGEPGPDRLARQHRPRVPLVTQNWLAQPAARWHSQPQWPGLG